jgi:carboxylate-amine ligase
VLGILVSGPADPQFAAARLLAREMSAPLLVPADLAVADGRLWQVTGHRPRRIDVLLRLATDSALEEAPDADGAALGQSLRAVAAAGQVLLANPLGTGASCGRALHALLPRLVEYYLAERPVLDNVPTYLCADPDQRAAAFERLDALVWERVDGSKPAFVAGSATPAQLQEARRKVLAAPARWVARDLGGGSSAPGLRDGGLEPVPVGLRVFTVAAGAVAVDATGPHQDGSGDPVAAPATFPDIAGVAVLPAPLTSCRPDAATTAGGPARQIKDTWLVP